MKIKFKDVPIKCGHTIRDNSEVRPNAPGYVCLHDKTNISDCNEFECPIYTWLQNELDDDIEGEEE